MKEHVQKTGVRKYAGNDLIELQSEPLKALQRFFEECGPCIIQGCGITPAGNLHHVAPGIVALAGKDAEGNDTFKVVQFDGVENVSLPIFLTLAYTVVERAYGDSKVKPIAYNYTASASGVRPAENVPFLEIGVTGGRKFVDAVRITDKLDMTGNGKDVTVTFSETAERTNVESGEKLSGLFGKVRKWFSSLKAVAFSGKAADLTDDEAHRFTTDTEKTGWNDKYTKAEEDQKHRHIQENANNYTDNAVSVLENTVYKKTDTYTKGETDTKDNGVLALAQEYARQKIGEIIGSSPAALDTLYELAAALNNDPAFATTVMNMINGKADAWHTHTKAQITDFPTSMPASDVYAWAKAASKPGYTAAEVGAASAGHDHTGVYQPAGNYAPANHNHDSVYQPKGSYAAANHGHNASAITEETNKRFMTDAERSKLAGIEVIKAGTSQDCNSYTTSGKFSLNNVGLKNAPSSINIKLNGNGAFYIILEVEQTPDGKVWQTMKSFQLETRINMRHYNPIVDKWMPWANIALSIN